MPQVKPTQSLRLGELQAPIESYLTAVVNPGSAARVQVGPLLKRWIAIGLAVDVAQMKPDVRKRVGQVPKPESLL